MRTRLTIAFVLLVSAALLLIGCGKFFVNTTDCSSVSVTPASQTISTAQSQAFSASCPLSSGGSQDVTSTANWSSSSASVACMIGNVAIGISQSSSPVTISAVANNHVGTASLTVNGSTLTAITVTPPAATTITHGTTANFTASGTVGSATQNVTSIVHWTSSNTAVATIDSSGLLTAISAGTTSISASLCGGVSVSPSSTTITVQ